MDSRTAKRYAKALFHLSQDVGTMDAVRDDIKSVHRTLEQSAEFQRFIGNPLVPSEQRRAALAELFQGRLQTMSYNFLQLLEAKGRLALLSGICHAFEGLYDDAAGITHATIRSAHPLDEGQVESIVQRLGQKLGRTVRAKTEVNPKLLGGFSIQVAGNVYDASAATLLQTFKQRLIHA